MSRDSQDLQDRDEKMMLLALDEARKAGELGEVPIGAIVVDQDGTVIGRGHNLRETTHDPTAHAEILALRQASQVVGSWRLTGSTLYVTIEPCPMCAGAIIMARVDRVVYGAEDPKAGAVDTLYQLLNDSRLNHQSDVTAGVLHAQCAGLMQDFFRRLRRKGV